MPEKRENIQLLLLNCTTPKGMHPSALGPRTQNVGFSLGCCEGRGTSTQESRGDGGGKALGLGCTRGRGKCSWTMEGIEVTCTHIEVHRGKMRLD